MAKVGSDLMHTVSVKGRTHRPDINIPYHTTIKLFNPEKDSPEQIHEVASKLNMTPPNPANVGIEPATLKGRNGNTMHVLKLHGPHAEEIKEHHKKFAQMGHPEKYEFHPHITVDEALYNHAIHSGAKTAADLGITFGNAELHHKDKVVASYKPKAAGQPGQETPADKLNRSEPMTADLQKGILRNIGTAAAMGSALLSHPAHAASGDLHEYVNHFNKLPGVKAQSHFQPHKKGSRDGAGEYRINIGRYQINGEHNSLNGNNNHNVSYDAPKNPTERDHEDARKTKFLLDKLHTSGRKLLDKSEVLEKGALRNLGTAAAMGSALLSGHAHAPTTDHPKYSSDRMLGAISSVESGKG